MNNAISRHNTRLLGGFHMDFKGFEKLGLFLIGIWVKRWELVKIEKGKGKVKGGGVYLQVKAHLSFLH